MGLYSAKLAWCAVAGALLFPVAGCGSATTSISAVPLAPMTTTMTAGPESGPANLHGSAVTTPPRGVSSHAHRYFGTYRGGGSWRGTGRSGEQHQQDAGERNGRAATPRIPGPGRTGTRRVLPRRGGRVRGATDSGSPRRLRRLRRSWGTRTLAGGQRTGQLPPRDRPGLRPHLRFPGEPRTYLHAVRPVVPGGWNIIGPTWVLHVETQSMATEVQRQIGGSANPTS